MPLNVKSSKEHWNGDQVVLPTKEMVYPRFFSFR